MSLLNTLKPLVENFTQSCFCTPPYRRLRTQQPRAATEKKIDKRISVLKTIHIYGERPRDKPLMHLCSSTVVSHFHDAAFVPDLPEGSISQLEVVGSKTAVLEAESLAGCQVQTLILANNRLQHVADRAFR